jgi:hypothetical protein
MAPFETYEPELPSIEKDPLLEPIPSPEPSKRFKLNKQDISKIFKGAIIAVAGAILTYLTQLSVSLPNGTYTPLITAGFAIVANILWKWLKNNQS